jgi:hypothetical protein
VSTVIRLKSRRTRNSADAAVVRCGKSDAHNRPAHDRLLDANRTIGQPPKLTIIFGRRISRYHHGKLQTVN